MEIVLFVVGCIFLYAIIILAINNSKLSIRLKQNNDLSRANNKLLKEIRDLMKESVDDKTIDQKTSGHIIDEKL